MTSSPHGGRTLVMGDIHGCDTALARVLDAVMRRSDTLIVLGDVVDRGPDSRAVIDMLLQVESFSTLIAIRGNHEEMMLDAIQRGRHEMLWLQHGGQEGPLDSYGGNYSDIPRSHLKFLNRMIDYYETPRWIFTHANLEPGVELADQSPEWLRWTRYQIGQPAWETGQRVFVGHTPQTSGLPVIENDWVCLDTLAYGGKYLTCVDLNTDEVIQARDTGELRRGVTLADLAELS